MIPVKVATFYIYGGPYDAREELEARFDGIVPENVNRETRG